ncbi:DUF5703 family protein [Brevibacterium sp. 50QC2O2]|jgi:hypothetical protein|uniref:DUF5703 family protein n=1 Tax=Brevibacterium TaxID=1696 RepID=UPI00211BE5FE|nr:MULTISPECIES: DUF5703 family protein [unclassified Brevibacterium]MCQ9366784.1 DUF5703 family protein [Brevibacterium sp. 91QC2O2]MCQ9383934.1 DUF5703 family protein [Brevibacterium sp. 68QC2CO]MCQ9388863.1 DUF5703 family protein [Brevibacterium sp. 50QC2O2]
MQRTRADIEYEYRTVRFQPHTPKSVAYREVSEATEYGKWELARTLIHFGGARTVVLKRRIIRMQRTA